MVFRLLNNALIDMLEFMVDARSKPTIMVIGGEVDKELSPVCWSLTESDQFEEFCEISSVDFKHKHSICKTPQGFVITGGVNSDLCMMFLAASRSWIRMQNMPNKRYAHGSICVKGLLLVCGGLRWLNGSSSSVYCCVDFLVIKGGASWQKGPDLPTAVSYPKVSNIDESVYLLDEATKELLHLDITNKIWTERASLPVEGFCYGVSMTSTKDKLCVAGGRKKVCALYDPTTDVWTPIKQPMCMHFYGTLVSHNNKFLLLGGSYSDGTDEVEEYSVEDDAWSVCAYKMPAKLILHHGLLLDLPAHH